MKSRSADPGQSSYGGFKNEDPSRQAQELDPAAPKDGSTSQKQTTNKKA